MRIRMWFRVWLCAVVSVGTLSEAGAETTFLAVVGTVDPTASLLKVVRIADPGGNPTTEEAEVDLTGVFGSSVAEAVRDVAFLARIGGGPARIAVLGKCDHYVPYETGWWWGDTHRIRGTIGFYTVSDEGPLAIVPRGTVSFEEWFDTAWGTVNTDTVADTPRESYRIAGLASGGFVVEANGARKTCSLGGCGDDLFSSYSRLVFFDAAGARRFGAAGPTPYQTEERDIAGLAGSVPDRLVWAYQGVPGGPGGLYRFEVDWFGTMISQEAYLAGVPNAGCYYFAQVAPLPRVPGHIVGGGCCVRNNAAASYNVPADHPEGAGLSDAQGWGFVWPGAPAIDELVTVRGLDPDAGVFLRRNGVEYQLYRVAPAEGSYTATGYTFTWSGTPWSLIRSDGEALGAAAGVMPRIVAFASEGATGQAVVILFEAVPPTSTTTYELQSATSPAGPWMARTDAVLTSEADQSKFTVDRDPAAGLVFFRVMQIP